MNYRWRGGVKENGYLTEPPYFGCDGWITRFLYGFTFLMYGFSVQALIRKEPMQSLEVHRTWWLRVSILILTLDIRLGVPLWRGKMIRAIEYHQEQFRLLQRRG